MLRFCQQCSKLQPVEAFEGERRSCVESLDRREWVAGRPGAGRCCQATATGGFDGLCACSQFCPLLDLYACRACAALGGPSRHARRLARRG